MSMSDERRSLLQTVLYKSVFDAPAVVPHLVAQQCLPEAALTKYTNQLSVRERICFANELCQKGDRTFDVLFRAFIDTQQLRVAEQLRPLVSSPFLTELENVPRLEPTELCEMIQDISFHEDKGGYSSSFYDENKEHCYPITSPRGFCLIINNRRFAPPLPRRDGTEVDCKQLQELFSDLGYGVRVTEDLKAKDFHFVIRDFVNDERHVNASSAVICILSHGEKDCLFGSDGQQVMIHQLMSYLNAVNAPLLVSKPKLVFIQACRGERRDTGYVEEVDGASQSAPLLTPFSCVAGPLTRSRTPVEADILIAYATPTFYVSWRNSSRGSWFIQALCKVFKTHANDMDLLSMLTLVNHTVANHFETDRGNWKQMPEFHTRLTKKFYFFPPKSK